MYINCQQAKACSLDQLFELWLLWKLKENMFSMERVEQKLEWSISNEALKISDMAEVASARNRFDAALQLLVDKRDDGYDIL